MLEKRNFYSFSYDDLLSWITEKGEKPFAAKQVFQWVYRHKNHDVESWTNVSKSLKSLIQEEIVFDLPKIVWHEKSRDGTHKFLVSLYDKKTVEMVIIPAKDRMTLCLSSQVGCAVGCTFCHTGTMGLTRHLGAEEVVGQWIVAERFLAEKQPEKRLSNIVFMGQGEPLHNFKNSKKSCEIFLEPLGIGLGQRKVTLSTSGLVPQIEKLGDFPPVNIAISLHAAHNNLRTELMPINKVFDLEKLFGAIKSIPLKAHRRITYEYILIDGFNDRMEDINALVRLLDRKDSKVNIIPFNEYPESKFKRPSKQKISWFNEQLNQRGFISTVRVTKGDDILAACGQLKSELEDKPNLWTQAGSSSAERPQAQPL